MVRILPDLTVFPSAEAVLDSDAQAVIVGGHVYQNLDYAEQALEAGKHVLLEKPAGVNIEQLKRIHELSERRDCAFRWRICGVTIPLFTRCCGSPNWERLARFSTTVDTSQTDIVAPAVGAGVQGLSWRNLLRDAGHLIDLMVILMGEPKAVQPSLGRHYDSRSEVDNAVVVHEFENVLVQSTLLVCTSKVAKPSYRSLRHKGHRHPHANWFG